MSFEAEEKASLVAANSFTDWFPFRGSGDRNYEVEASGTFNGTLTVQTRSINGVAIDLEDFIAPFSRKGESVGSFDVRIGFKTGNYTSGQADVVIRR